MSINFDAAQEQAVTTALENPNYRWRTVQGVANETGLPAQTVEAVIRKNYETVVRSSIPSTEGEALYTTRSHFRKKASLGEKLLGAIKNRLTQIPADLAVSLFILSQANGNDVQIISVLLAAFGGIAINQLNLVELQKVEKDQRPDFRDPLYQLPLVVWPILGGVLAFAYETETDLSAILAINVGVSAPLIIRAFAAANPFAKSSIDSGSGA